MFSLGVIAVTTSPSLRATNEPIEMTIERLRTYVRRMERRYECPSDVMSLSVLHGHMKETAEVSKWLSCYRTLRELMELAGPETGITTTTTK